MRIIGIDPGLSGAIAILENNKVLNIFGIAHHYLLVGPYKLYLIENIIKKRNKFF